MDKAWLIAIPGLLLAVLAMWLIRRGQARAAAAAPEAGPGQAAGEPVATFEDGRMEDGPAPDPLVPREEPEPAGADEPEPETVSAVDSASEAEPDADAEPEEDVDTGLSPVSALRAPSAPEETTAADSVPEGAVDAPEEPVPPEPAPEAPDEDGRLRLAIVTGGEAAASDRPRHIELSITGRAPLPVIHGFDPATERLTILSDDPAADDVVLLPAASGAIQINLAGQPAAQVFCPAGAEALRGALEINP